jgi:hypothetical protein
VPAHPIYIPVYPAHPIVIPPDAIGPGVPTHPIVLPPPGRPTHPIVIPPDAISPGVPSHPIVLPPVPPLGIWGGPIDPYPDIGGPGPQPPAGAHPSHPIVIPPREKLVVWEVAWSEEVGWVVLGVPQFPHPAPS